jgi:pimeloyl-ACP methyl ester carboxylesterase
MPIAAVNNTEIYYEVHGDGPPLMLLPGLGRGTSYFDAITPFLSKKFTTIVLDPRGIDRSSRVDKELTAEVWADDFAALLDHLSFKKAHVLGSSHGGSMAMAMALQHPGKVESLMLFGAFSELNRFITLNLNLRIRLAHKLGMDEDMRDFIALWTFGHEFLDNENADKFLAVQLKAVREHTPERYEIICKSMLHWGRKLPGQEGQEIVTNLLHKIKCPTLISCGLRDFWIPASFSKIIAEKIKHSLYIEMPHCGHIAIREDPQGCTQMIEEFLKDHKMQ